MALARWAPLSGLVFSVLWLVLFFAVDEDVGDSDEEIRAWLSDSGERSYEIAAFFVILASALFFVWFLTVLRGRLANAEGRPGPFTALAFGAGLVAVTMWVIAFALFTSVAATVEFEDDYVIDPNTWRLTESVGYMIWIGGTTVASLLVLAVSVLSVRTGFLPKWIGWLGYLVALTMLVSFLFFPFLIFLAWLLIVSIALAWKPEGTAAQAELPAS